MRILHLEDSQLDAELIHNMLRQQWPECVISRVDDEQGFIAALNDGGVDLVLADYSLPLYSGRKALETSIEKNPDLPFVFISGSLGEELAIEMLKLGATDYVLKDRPARLVSAVQHALDTRDEKARHQLELKHIQAQMIQQEKMASIGQLAAGVAHEINNPVGFISSNLASLHKYMQRFTDYVQFLEKTIRDMGDTMLLEALESRRSGMKVDYMLGDVHTLLEECLDGTERVKAIVADLKSFSREDGSKNSPFDLNLCIKTTLNIVRNEYKYVADLETRLQEGLPEPVGNRQQISQVIANLVVNAAHAISGHGRITISSWHNGGHIFFSVSDTGQGIAPENLKKIFEPFFTTKEVGKGTGLGLSICYDIVNKHGGNICVESVPGSGSCFTVRLPLQNNTLNERIEQLDQEARRC
jgi:signal transduction histidine kinase